MTDTQRIDYLEREICEDGPLLLHNTSGSAGATPPIEPSPGGPGARSALTCEKSAAGQLTPAGFCVTCGMCRRHTVNTIADGVDYVAMAKRVAGRILRRAGWERLLVWGWICPKCVKVGCASREYGCEPHTLKSAPTPAKSPVSPGGAPCRG